MDNTIRNQYISRLAKNKISPVQAYIEIQKELEYNAENENLFRNGLFDEYIEAYDFFAHYLAELYCKEKGLLTKSESDDTID
jgi:hypothetical protein